MITYDSVCEEVQDTPGYVRSIKSCQIKHLIVSMRTKYGHEIIEDFQAYHHQRFMRRSLELFKDRVMTLLTHFENPEFIKYKGKIFIQSFEATVYSRENIRVEVKP